MLLFPFFVPAPASPRALLSLILASWCGVASVQAEDAPIVAAARVERGEIHRDVAFDAELRPYQEVELHARVTGYLDSLKVDAGDTVKEGQLLAVLDVPEQKIEIENALANERRGQAEVERARAAFDETHIAASRITKASAAQPGLIAQQDIDAAMAKDRAGSAALDAATAQSNVAALEVKKLRTMADYTQITAPFSGVITKRYSDPGALIQAGTNSGTVPLLRLSQCDKLRVVFPVSVSYVSQIEVGDPVDVRVTSLGRTIPAKVSRLNRKVETATRTMDVEVDLDNADLTLTPGIYATAVVEMERHDDALTVPVQAVSRDKSGAATVFLIGPDKKLVERQVKLGVETPSRLQVLEGLVEGDVVMIGSRTQSAPGQLVSPKIAMAEQTPAERTAEH